MEIAIKAEAELKQTITCKIMPIQASQKSDFSNMSRLRTTFVVLPPKFMKFYKADEEKQGIMLQMEYKQMQLPKCR